MRPRPEPMADEQGQDSFLDVVANMVGILIILVMVVGVRAGQAPIELDESPAETSPSPDLQPPSPQRGAGYEKELAEKLARARAHAEQLRAEVKRAHQQAQRIERESEAKDAERTRLATVRRAVELDIEAQQAAMDERSRRDFQLRTAFAHAHQQLEGLLEQQRGIESRPGKVVKVQNLPTPLSKPVFDSQEVHFHLRGGRVVYVPFDELAEEFLQVARNDVRNAPDQPGARLVKEVGPIGGFRLRYQLRTVNMPGQGNRVLPIRWELIPVADDLGEPIDQALQAGSRFRNTLAALPEGNQNVTIWAYEDSFAELRRLKAELHSLGYPTAVWPRKLDQPITASPFGSKSAAQ